MTPLQLMEGLKIYLEAETKTLSLLTRVEKNSTEKAERPPLVFIGSLPDKEGRIKQAPYILLKLLTGLDEEDQGTCRVRIIVTTYSEDNQENYIQCLNVITQIRTSLLKDRCIESRYLLQNPFEYIIYEEDTAPYQIGEIMTIWEIPTIQREVRKWLD